MMPDYTPKTDLVRDYYAGYITQHLSGIDMGKGKAEFDRWFANEIGKAHQSGYETARGDLISGAFIGGPTYEAVKASYTGQRIAVEVRTELIKSVADEIRAEQVCGCVKESDDPLDWHEVCRGAEFAARLLEDRL